MADIELLKRLAEAATPGEWFVGGHREIIWAEDEQPGCGRAVARALNGQGMPRESNASFIAAANPATVLALIAENERLSRFERAWDEWQKKTDWVQETAEPQELGMHRADVLRKRIDQLKAENSRLRQIISDSATACGAAISPACTVEFMGNLPAEIAGVLRQLRAELERLQEQQKPAGDAGAAENCRCNEKVQELQAELERARAEAERLRKHLAECSDSLESEILDRYGSSKDHPAMRSKFERDMQEVIDARAAMGKGGAQNGKKTAETRVNTGLEGGGQGANRAGGHSAENQAETRVSAGVEPAGKGGEA